MIGHREVDILQMERESRDAEISEGRGREATEMPWLSVSASTVCTCILYHERIINLYQILYVYIVSCEFSSSYLK